MFTSLFTFTLFPLNKVVSKMIVKDCKWKGGIMEFQDSPLGKCP